MRTTKAEREAAQLLRDSGIVRPPVDVEHLVRKLGIEHRKVPLEEGLSAVLYRRSGRPLMLVNRNHYPNRQRFSIAHEIGHFLLHKDTELFVDQVFRRDSRSSLGIDLKEIQANQFAASLLMPRSWMFSKVDRLLARKVCGEDELIRELARSFVVSSEAIRHRLGNLGVTGTF